jgi:hypothetical protein
VGEPLALLGAVPGRQQVQQREAATDEPGQLLGNLLRAAGDSAPGGRGPFPDQYADVVAVGQFSGSRPARLAALRTRSRPR